MKLQLTRYSKATYLSLIYLFFYLPIIILIIYSFNSSHYSLVWHGFSLNWYEQLFQDTGLQIVAIHSLMVGILAATLATLLGTLAAVCLYRYQFFGKNLLHSLMFILIVSPDIVMGISLLILFSIFKLPLGFGTLLISHITFCLPFVAVTIYSRISGLDKNIFEAAKDLGATEWVTFRKVIIPMLWPAILAGWLLSFTLSLDDVIISYFVTGPEFQILPLQIYSMVRLGISPELNALCSVMFTVTFGIALISQFMLRKRT
jgi:spermidine/putrescine transport system permease protein